MATTIVAPKSGTIKNGKAIQAKSRNHKVQAVGGNRYEVTSGSSGGVYVVQLTANGGTCNCEWGAHRPGADKRSGCSHVAAVFNHIATENGRTVSAWTDVTQAKKQHRPTLDIGDGVTLTARLKPGSILWTLPGGVTQVLEV